MAKRRRSDERREAEQEREDDAVIRQNRQWVSHDEQKEMGLIPTRKNYVPPERTEILPPQVTRIPDVVDPYAHALPQTVHQVERFTATPVTRAQAFLMRFGAWLVLIIMLTGAILYVMQWYPHEWTYFAIFVFWLSIALGISVLVLIVLTIVDFWETPAGQNRHVTNRYMKVMEKEQDHRLRAMYPEQYQKGKWKG